MAFAAQTENVPRVAWLLFLANVLWVTVYDTLYAMVDREDDLKIGVRSSAIVFGEADRHVIACLQAMVLLTLYLVGQEAHLGVWYRAGEAAAAIFFLYQLLLIRRREPSACFAAFGNNQYVGMAVFIGIALDYLYR
jgi:4-hydroxybenzoate polyprenyltransferase